MVLIAAPLIVIYPLMKRVTNFPQLFLGVVFNLGVFLSWYIFHEEVSIIPLMLYASCVLWTMGYDTIYGHQDKNDDQRIGVKSTALFFGDKSGQVVIGLYNFVAILWALIGFIIGLNILFFIGVGLCYYHLMWQAQSVNFNNPSDCGDKFRSNLEVGLIFTLSLIVGFV